MSVSSLVLVAAAASAYVVPLRARAPLRSTLRAQAIDAGAQNATEFSAGLVSDGAAVKTPSPFQQLSDAFGLKDASDAVAWAEPLSSDPLSAIAPDFTSSLSFSTPEVATPTRLSLIHI